MIFFFFILHLLELPLFPFSVLQSVVEVDLFLVLYFLPCYCGKCQTWFKLEEYSKFLCTSTHFSIVSSWPVWFLLAPTRFSQPPLDITAFHLQVFLYVFLKDKHSFLIITTQWSTHLPLMSNIYSVFTFPHCFLMIFICNVAQTWSIHHDLLMSPILFEFCGLSAHFSLICFLLSGSSVLLEWNTYIILHFQVVTLKIVNKLDEINF